MTSQIIQLSSPDTSITVGQQFEVTVTYDVENADNSLTGIGFRIHFDSNQLELNTITPTFATSLFGSVASAVESIDDLDPNTNTQINWRYLDFFGNWPNQALPLTLGTLNFTALENFDGSQLNITFSSTAAGFTGEGLPLALTLEEIPINNPPTFTSGNAFTIPENSTTVGNITAIDPDEGDTLTYSIRGGADGDLFDIDPTTGALSFISAPDFENPLDDGDNNVYDVVITVTDQGGLTDEQSIEVTVTDVNEAPNITNANAFTLPENTTAVGTVTATDPDAGDTLTFSLTGGADANLFEINANTGALRFKQAPDFEIPQDETGNNVYDVEVTVTDTGGLTAQQSIAVTVTDVNEAPIVNQPIADQTAREADAFSLTIPENTFTDPEGDTLFLSAFLEDGTTALPSWLSFDADTLTFSGTPSSDDVGILTVGVFANDGFLTTSDVFTITIAPREVIPNRPPTINSTTFSIEENITGVGTIEANDPDGDTLIFSISGGADANFFEINPNTGALSFKQAPDFEIPLDQTGNNVYDLEVTVTDTGGLTAQQSIAVTVTDVNEAPIVNQPIADQTAREADAFSLTIPENTFTDPEGDTLFFSATLEDGTTPLPSWLSFDADTFTFSGTPSSGDVGTVTVEVFANDGELTTSDVFTVTIQPLPSLAISATDANKNEGNEGVTPFTFTVTRSENTTGELTVNYDVTGSGDNGANAADFGGTLPSGSVTFADGETEKVVTIDVSGDTDFEPNETFTVNITAPDTNITTASATGTIVNDDQAPIILPSLVISATDANKEEGNEGVTPFTFTVTRSENTTGELTVNYAVTGSGDNGANAADFGGTLPSGSVTFADGETSQTITINVSGDTTIEPDETFTVTISAEDANISSPNAVGTIINDDTIGTVLNEDVFRFNTGAGFIFVGQEEKQRIEESNFPNFALEGSAFNLSLEEKDDLIAFNRFQNSQIPGAYLYATEEESVSVREQYPQFVEEGIGFYAFDSEAGQGTDIYRFNNNGTYIYVAEAEKDNILANYSQFVLEGVAFEAVIL